MTGNTGLWQGRAEPSTLGTLCNRRASAGPKGLYERSVQDEPTIATDTVVHNVPIE